MRKTTILLDAGGVLIDETELERCVCRVVTGLVQTLECTYTEKDYWTDTNEAVVRFCPRTPWSVLWKRCRGVPERYIELLEQYKANLAKERPPLVLYAEMKDEIPILADAFRLVLAGQYGTSVYDLLEQHGLAQYFANRLSQEDFGITKPDPRYLAQIAERSGVATDECIMVDDRIDKGIIPAKQNNMGTVFVQTGIYRIQEPRTLDEVPDITLKSLTGLAERVIACWRE